MPCVGLNNLEELNIIKNNMWCVGDVALLIKK